MFHFSQFRHLYIYVQQIGAFAYQCETERLYSILVWSVIVCWYNAGTSIRDLKKNSDMSACDVAIQTVQFMSLKP